MFYKKVLTTRLTDISLGKNEELPVKLTPDGKVELGDLLLDYCDLTSIFEEAIFALDEDKKWDLKNALELVIRPGNKGINMIIAVDAFEFPSNLQIESVEISGKDAGRLLKKLFSGLWLSQNDPRLRILEQYTPQLCDRFFANYIGLDGAVYDAFTPPPS